MSPAPSPSADLGARNSAPRPRYRVLWEILAGIVFYHAVALLAFVPWFFSWTGVILALLGLYVFGTLGINIGFHRLLTHRGFRCPKWFERALITLGVCCVQEAPTYWVAIHRRHHQSSDEDPDPHSPLVGFFWSHVGWICVEPVDEKRQLLIKRHAADLLADPYHAWLDRIWYLLAPATWVIFFAAGWGAISLTAGAPEEAIRFGWSLLIWGVFVRTVAVWHITWSVNSVTHLWGYRNYETADNSRNNFFIALISNGEGWHNNHHADPTSARHGHRWWELDIAYLTIRAFAKMGLIWGIVPPARRLQAKSTKAA